MIESSHSDNSAAGSSLAAPDDDQREHFIPIRKADLVRTLCSTESLNGEQRTKLQQLSRLLEATFHYEFHQDLESLKEVYACFDPDADTLAMGELSEEQRKERIDDLFKQFESLLVCGNFKKLSQQDIEQALESAGHWGLRLDVDFDVFNRLEVFARGAVEKVYAQRSWQRLFLQQRMVTQTYQRLVIIFCLNDHRRVPPDIDTRTVYIKVFKNIPKMDLDTLLPCSIVKMTLLDRGKIMLPTATGVGMTVLKLFQGAIVISVAGIYGLLAFIGLVVGTIGYGIKSFLGYLHTKDKHQLNLTKNLYFQNLDNNAGVLFRLLDDAEEQEFREAYLAYVLLWMHQPPDGWNEQQLDDAAETYLYQKFGLNVDFEAPDAIKKLKRLSLVEIDDQQRMRAVEIDEALTRLDYAWDNFFPYNNCAGPA